MRDDKRTGLPWTEGVFLILLGAAYFSVAVFSLQHNTTENVFTLEILWTVFASILLTFAVIRNGITITLIGNSAFFRWFTLPFLSGLCALMAIAVILELGDGSVQLFSGRSIVVFGMEISKSGLLDIVGVIVFPWTVMILAHTRELYYFVPVIAAVTLFNAALFWQQTALFFLWLACLHIAAVSAALFFTVGLKQRYAAGWSLLYILLWGLVVSFHRGNRSMQDWLLPLGWRQRKYVIQELIQNARFWGRSQATEHTFALLKDSIHPIQSLLFYGGWLPVVVYLITLAFLVLEIFRCLTAPKVCKRYDFCILVTAAANLLLRTVLGLFAEFGVLPLRVGLPFSTELGFQMDTMSLTLLLSGAIQVDGYFYEGYFASDEEIDGEEDEDGLDNIQEIEYLDEAAHNNPLELESKPQALQHDFPLTFAEHRVFYILLVIMLIAMAIGLWNSTLNWLQETVKPLASSWIETKVRYL